MYFLLFHDNKLLLSYSFYESEIRKQLGLGVLAQSLRGCRQSIGLGYSHLKPWLGLVHLFPGWLNHIAMGQRPQLFARSGLEVSVSHQARVLTIPPLGFLSVLTPWQLAFLRASNPRKRRQPQCLLWPRLRSHICLFTFFLHIRKKLWSLHPQSGGGESGSIASG